MWIWYRANTSSWNEAAVTANYNNLDSPAQAKPLHLHDVCSKMGTLKALPHWGLFAAFSWCLRSFPALERWKWSFESNGVSPVYKENVSFVMICFIHELCGPSGHWPSVQQWPPMHYTIMDKLTNVIRKWYWISLPLS